MYALVIIPPNGPVRIETYNTRPGLTPLQAAVGGCIERVKVRYDGRVREAYANENGLAERLPFNPAASAICAEFGYGGIVGPLAVLIPNAPANITLAKKE